MAKILVVDDYPAARDALAALLTAWGHEIVAKAGDGAQALQVLRGGCCPDLVVLDLEMPVMNGWEFVAALNRGDAPPAPIIVLTASSYSPPVSSLIVAVFIKASVDAVRLSRMIDDVASSARA